ncbi:MAG: MBL fold metallo-hydrolase [Tranquillimonas sp.]
MTRDGLHHPWPEAPEPGTVRAVAPGVLWLRLPLPMALDHVNVYVLEDDDGWTVVDTGLDTRTTRRAWEAALTGPLADRPVVRVIVTHHHPDHVGLAGWFVAQGAELWTTRTSYLMARMLLLDEQDRPTDETLAFWRAAGMPGAMLAERAASRPFNFADCCAPLPLGYRRLRDGDRLRLAGRDWSVRVGNGHAPEQATLWSEDVVLAGDQILPNISPNLGVHATEPEADPVAEWLESCARLARGAGPGHLVLPGHKTPFRGLPLRLSQLEQNHRGALERLEAHLARPSTAVECFAPLFKRGIGAGEYGLALSEAMAHCLHLWHAGRVTRTGRADGAWIWQRAAG